MAYDANREDYQRLGLRFARSLDGSDAQGVTRAFATFGRRFAQNRDSLPQTDADRAFHLVAVAATSIDYELPFASDERAGQIIERGHRLLDEALELDPDCHDAIRMREAAAIGSFEGYYDFLREGADEVRAHCEEARRKAAAGFDDERAALEADIAMRPYLRWLATQAAKAVICGHNREAVRLVESSLELDPQDTSDARFTAAIAYAKLEDEAGLDALARHEASRGVRRDGDDAWMQLAHITLAHRQHDLMGARMRLRRLAQTYPYAADALLAQKELPDGVFARLAVPPFSEDELILALSEGTVLLQEGRDRDGRGSLGCWLATEARRMGAREMPMPRGGTREGRQREDGQRP